MLSYKRLVFCLLSCYLLMLCPSVLASRGDQLDKFRACVSENVAHRCTKNGKRLRSGHSLPLSLRLTGWTCASDIDYQCQRAITDYLVKNGESVEQYHGKWPFYRLLGIQEPASVLFSILNGYVHLRGLRRIKTQVSRAYEMRKYYVFFAYVGMNAWLWSTIFHIRDFNFTEKMDYFSAGAYVLYGLFYAVIQVFRLHAKGASRGIITCWAAICLACFLAHISYLAFITFDYGYNMLANIMVGSIHGLIWVYYSVCNWHIPHARWPAYLVVMLTLAMSLELLDFPPLLYIIDAHSLWHLATIPITAWWYTFLCRDAVYHTSNIKDKGGFRM